MNLVQSRIREPLQVPWWSGVFRLWEEAMSGISVYRCSNCSRNDLSTGRCQCGGSYEVFVFGQLFLHPKTGVKFPVNQTA